MYRGAARFVASSGWGRSGFSRPSRHTGRRPILLVTYYTSIVKGREFVFCRKTDYPTLQAAQAAREKKNYLYAEILRRGEPMVLLECFGDAALKERREKEQMALKKKGPS